MEQQTLQQQRQTRIQEKLRRELGPAIGTALADDDVIEVLVTGQGDVWLDRLSVGKERTGVVLPEPQREMVIGTIAAWHGLVVNRQQPLLKAELPLDGARFQGMVRPVSAPAFVIRRPFQRIIPSDQYIADGSMTAAQAALSSRIPSLAASLALGTVGLTLHDVLSASGSAIRVAATVAASGSVATGAVGVARAASQATGGGPIGALRGMGAGVRALSREALAASVPRLQQAGSHLQQQARATRARNNVGPQEEYIR
jgi:hypothetical protein